MVVVADDGYIPVIVNITIACGDLLIAAVCHRCLSAYHQLRTWYHKTGSAVGHIKVVSTTGEAVKALGLL